MKRAVLNGAAIIVILMISAVLGNAQNRKTVSICSGNQL
jgi:hypothetical protein